MSVGRGITKNDIDQRMSSAVEQVWNSLNNINQASLWLANTNIVPNDTFLTNLGYTSGEVTLLRAAVNDLGHSTNGLWAVAHNLKTVPSTNNFFFSGQQITGVNWAG
jgi:hypothetical protein